MNWSDRSATGEAKAKRRDAPDAHFDTARDAREVSTNLYGFSREFVVSQQLYGGMGGAFSEALSHQKSHHKGQEFFLVQVAS